MRTRPASRAAIGDADRPFLFSIFIGLAAATIGMGAMAAALALTLIP